jgi:nuclear pore complex protein Nup98-Nup96
MDEKDTAFHESFKPRWGPMDTIICAKDDLNEPFSDTNTRWKERYSIFSEARDVTILGYNPPTEVIFPSSLCRKLR